jgi:protein-disulfide isomerase
VLSARAILKKSPSSLAGKVESARAKGNPKARVKIVEYLDFQCPACATGAIFLRELMKKYPSDIYLQVKFFPISNIHEHAIHSATYAECAARQNKFWIFKDQLIDRQSQWSRLLNADSVFREIAREVNLDFPKLEACVDDEKVKIAILREKADGKTLGIQSTPTYFVNGKMVVGHKFLKEELKNYFGEQINQ